jgi:hypothetical protein
VGVVKGKGGELLVDAERRKERWREYFASLGQVGDESDKFDEGFKREVEGELQIMGLVSDECNNDVLDRPLVEDEVRKALSEVKNGKAPGEDGVLTEVLKGGGDVIVQSLFMLFKKVWDMEEFPSQWMRGVICPLFKGGDVQDCGDYRGIALLSIVGKVLGRVLNSRLMAFAESGEIVEEQFGFRPGRGCVDAAFVFSEVVKGRKDIGKATFCAFIDVRKAYDRVWRDGLWKRLWEAGVKGKMWRVLRALYKEVKSCVMVDGELSEWFETLVGVRQGCVLSPVLYSLFINGFAKFLKEKSVGGVEVAEEWLRLLLFADDIVLFAESEEELQEMLNLLSEYCRRWRFEINVGKSKVMVCGPRGLTTQVTAKWWLAGKEMGRVRVYKYVGMWMNEECTWGDQMAMVREKAMKLTNMMKGWLFKHWGLSVRTKVEVWKAMVGRC